MKKKLKLINSKDNNFFKYLKKLKKRKYRENEKVFIAEGYKIYELNKNPKHIIINEEKINDYNNLIELENCTILSDNLFKEISTQENSKGLIIIYEFAYKNIEDLNGDLVILDRIQDPGNLGTIIRVLDAVGLNNLVLVKGTCDPYNEKSVRATMGSIFNINISFVDEDNLISYLKENGYNILTTALEADSVPYTKMIKKEKNAIILGNEGQGVSKNLLNISDQKLIIPIYGKAESLNVAIATSVMLYKYIEL